MARSMWRSGGRYGIRIHRAKSSTRRIWTRWGRLLRPSRRVGDGSWSVLFHEPPKEEPMCEDFWTPHSSRHSASRNNISDDNTFACEEIMDLVFFGVHWDE